MTVQISKPSDSLRETWNLDFFMWNVSIFKKLAQLFLKHYIGQQNMSVGCQFVSLVLKQDHCSFTVSSDRWESTDSDGKAHGPTSSVFLNVLTQPVGECKAGVSSSRGVSQVLYPDSGPTETLPGSWERGINSHCHCMMHQSETKGDQSPNRRNESPHTFMHSGVFYPGLQQALVSFWPTETSFQE